MDVCPSTPPQSLQYRQVQSSPSNLGGRTVLSTAAELSIINAVYTAIRASIVQFLRADSIILSVIFIFENYPNRMACANERKNRRKLIGNVIIVESAKNCTKVALNAYILLLIILPVLLSRQHHAVSIIARARRRRSTSSPPLTRPADDRALPLSFISAFFYCPLPRDDAELLVPKAARERVARGARAHARAAGRRHRRRPEPAQDDLPAL